MTNWNFLYKIKVLFVFCFSKFFNQGHQILLSPLVQKQTFRLAVFCINYGYAKIFFFIFHAYNILFIKKTCITGKLYPILRISITEILVQERLHLSKKYLHICRYLVRFRVICFFLICFISYHKLIITILYQITSMQDQS